MKDLDFTTLRLFVQVCETHSILRVSERENIVPSAITKRISKLEAELRVTLLRRGQGGVIPTPAGLALAANARSLLQESRRLHESLALYKDGAAGSVALMATNATVAGNVTEDIAAFMREPQFRDARITLTQGITSDVVLAVREGRVALGIVWDMVELGGLSTLPYGNDHLVLGARPDHPLAQYREVSAKQAFAHEYISYPWAQGFIDLLLRARAMDSVPPQPRITVPSHEAAMRCAAVGLGTCVIPIEAAQPLATALGLKLIGIDADWSRRHHAICFRDDASLSPIARQLMDYLSRRAQQRESATRAHKDEIKRTAQELGARP